MAGASPGAVSPGDWSLSGEQVSSIHRGPTRDGYQINEVSSNASNGYTYTKYPASVEQPEQA
jgi:hypothetical protein